MKMFDGHPAGLYCLRHGDVFVQRAWRHPGEHKATTEKFNLCTLCCNSWTPRADLRQLIMQRQTLPEVCGVARLGTKLGLRCRVEFAAALSAKIRPEQVFLPQGDKLTFLVGPMPYGTLKSSLTKAMSENG